MHPALDENARLSSVYVKHRRPELFSTDFKFDACGFLPWIDMSNGHFQTSAVMHYLYVGGVFRLKDDNLMVHAIVFDESRVESFEDVDSAVMAARLIVP